MSDKINRIVLAFSGGLDTSVILKDRRDLLLGVGESIITFGLRSGGVPD